MLKGIVFKGLGDDFPISNDDTENVRAIYNRV